MKKNFIYSLCLSLVMVCFTLSAAAQTNYSGKVVDVNGQPVIGATIMVVGSNVGTTSGVDGSFSLPVPAKGQVEISYLGYLSQTISDLSQKEIVLKEDAQKMEEVVIVGYGSMKKAHLTGSVATVEMEEIQDISSGSLAVLLSGMMPGVSVSGGEARPGTNATISIRDNSTVTEALGGTAQEPLFVIDGFVYPNDMKVGNVTQNMGSIAFNNLDPSMIESISVLKDASAAVYGARAANGVILVTTKKGKLGAPSISYSGSIGIADEVSRAKMLNTYQYGLLYNATAAADPRNTNLDIRRDLFQADELEAMKSLKNTMLDRYWDAALTQKHSINMSGATEKASYSAGVAYFDQDGNLGRLSYDRWNYNAGVNLKIGKWVDAGLSITGDYGTKKEPLMKVGGSSSETDYNYMLTLPGYIPEYVNGYPMAAYGVSNGQVSERQLYHFAELQNLGDYSKTMSSNMNIGANISYDFGWSKILKGLKLRVSYSKSISSDKTNQESSAYHMYKMVKRAGSGEHLYTPVPGQEAEYEALMNESNFVLANNGTKVDNGVAGGAIYRTMSRADSYQLNFTASYNRTFGKHTVGALFSIEKSESESEWLQGQVTNPYEFSWGQANSVGFGSVASTNMTRAEAGTLSYVGRVNYNYDGKYLFEFLLRSDASTKFAPENYWGMFPSVSAGWIISQEDWFADNVKWIDFLKVRASFGLTGRDNTNAWQWMQMYGADKDKGPVFGFNGNAGNHLTLNKNNSAINRDAHWDKSYKGNFGIDWSLLNSRLSMTIEGYYSWNRDMLVAYNESVPATVGTPSAKVNYGEMDSWGMEFSVNWKDKIGKDFTYKIGINTGWSDNKVLVKDWGTNPTYNSMRPGDRTDQGTWGMQCIGMFRSFQDINEYFEKYGITEYMGMTQDRVRPGMLIYKDIRGTRLSDGTYEPAEGIVSSGNDQVRISNRGNRYGFTANIGLDYKSLSLTAQISASWGGYATVPSSALKPGSSFEYTNMPSFWKPENMYAYQDVYDASGNLVVAENRDAKYPNLAYTSVNNVTSTFWRISAARATLNRLTLAYRIPSKWTQKIGIQSVRVNVTGQNLLSFYNPYPDKFMDPMAGSYGNYPTLRKFTLGLNVTF